MSEHNYNGTVSSFDHATANASSDNGTSQLGANLEKLDQVKIRFEDIYLHLKYVTPKVQIQETLKCYKMMEKFHIFLNEELPPNLTVEEQVH